MSMPRVTNILEKYGPDFSQVNPITLQAAIERGNRVHAICSAIAQGLWVPKIDVNIQSYIDSFEKWFETVDRIILVEKRLESKTWGYTGQPDIICMLKNDPCIILIDYKSPLNFHPLWLVQVSGYKVLAEEALGIKVERWGSLRLRKNGNAPIFNEADENAVVAWFNVLGAYKYMNEGR